MAIVVGCKLDSVNFCPGPGIHERSYNRFAGGRASPDSPTQYTDVAGFCEFLRTTAVLNGDHSVRRAWISCLRGGAYFWFYHFLPMGARKHLADADLDEVVHALMAEFGSFGPTPPSSAPNSDKESLSSLKSGTHLAPQMAMSVHAPAGHPSGHPTGHPVGHPIGHPSGYPPGHLYSVPSSPSRSPRPPSGSRIPRSPARDDGLPFAGHCLDGQFGISSKGATTDGQDCHRYPTHQDAIQHNAADKPCANANASANANGNDSTRGGLQRLSETSDQSMADAPRTPSQRSPGQRSSRQRTPSRRSPISKSRSSLSGKPARRDKEPFSIRSIGMSDGLVPCIESRPGRRTRASQRSG